MKIAQGICAFATVMMMAGCSSGMNTLKAFNKAEPVGSPYTKQLAMEYRELANQMQGRNTLYLYSDAQHFARKGLASIDGVIVMPEVISDWDLPPDSIVEMAHQRVDLVDALENGGRETAPQIAAVAQTRFDCWILQQDSHWKSEETPCKEQFLNAMQSLKNAVPRTIPDNAAPAEASIDKNMEEFPAPITTDMSAGSATPAQQATFIVFFDWDKHNLSQSAYAVLDAVAKEVKGRQDFKQIVIVGHTDTSGSEKYNDRLSFKRGNAVRDNLISAGYPADKIRVEGRGEKELLVSTPDNIRQPENRRAQITLE